MRLRRLYLCFAVIAAFFLLPSSLRAQVQFVDTTTSSGLLPYSMADGLGGGVAAADFNDDGDVDLFVPNSAGTPDQLYENDGSGHYTDVAATAGLDSTANHRAALWFDCDGDHRLDLIVAGDCYSNPPLCSGLQVLILYRQVADGVFVDTTSEAGLLNLISL